RTRREPRAAARGVRAAWHRAIGRAAAQAVVRRMIPDPPVVARMRAELAAQVHRPLTVSATSHQYYFDEDSAAYNEIEVRHGEAFAMVVVRGSLPSEEFVVRVWHHYADEVWLIDSVEQVVFVVPRTGVIRVY